MADPRRYVPTLMLVMAVALLSPGASAQEAVALSGSATEPVSIAQRGGGSEPSQFGTNWAVKVIPASEFVPTTSSAVWTTYDAKELASDNAGLYSATIDLPPGTEVEQICQLAFDNHATSDVSMKWHLIGVSADHVGSHAELATASTTNAPGRTMICATPPSPVPIRAYGDVDGDGLPEYAIYYVEMFTPGFPDNLRFGPLIVKWRRAVSPAPTTATFPNDVPTTHPFFQFVEALAASGITAGCGTGSYCPDQPLTRGQMAVFLTGALGLYWPW